MDLRSIVKKLHPLERSVVPTLGECKTVEEIQEKTNLQEIEVIRALQWLGNKKIVELDSAEDEVIDVLKNYQKNYKLPVVFHCFTGSKKLLNFCLDNLYYISLSGIITFKNADKLRDIIKFADKDYLLIETDSPFLAPMPKRGKKNEPSYIKYTLEKLSELKDISSSKISDITTQNFENLFSL